MEELIFSSVSTNVAVLIFMVGESMGYQVELHRSGSVLGVGEERDQLGRGPSLRNQSFTSHAPHTPTFIEGCQVSL